MEIQNIFIGLVTIIIGYFIGSISMAIAIAKFRGIDIKSYGSGNAGATNVTRALGKKTGALTMFLDMSKPIISAAIAFIFVEYVMKKEGSFFIQLASLAAGIGHIFPILHKFKGGKGAACTAGILILSNWLMFPIGFAVFLIILFLTKYVSLSSLGSIFILSTIYCLFTLSTIMIGPIFSFLDPDYWYVTITIQWLMFFVVTFAHRKNIKRLIDGNERKAFQKNKN